MTDDNTLHSIFLNGVDFTDKEVLRDRISIGYHEVVGEDLTIEGEMTRLDATQQKVGQALFIVMVEWFREIGADNVANELWLNQRDQLGDFTPQSEAAFKRRAREYVRDKFLDMDNHLSLMFQHAILGAFMAGASLTDTVYVEVGEENNTFQEKLSEFMDDALLKDLLDDVKLPYDDAE